MLDAVAGHIAKRIRAHHHVRQELLGRSAAVAAAGGGPEDEEAAAAVADAVRSPADVEAVLRAYADRGHVSVAVPELVRACARQVRHHGGGGAQRR